MNYYEHFLGDYAKKTKRLSMLDHGAYRLMLDAYYAEETPLPAPYDELWIICGAASKADQQSVRKVADKFFPVGPDGLRHNERADDEIARAQKRINASRENGKGGGRKPTGNPPGNPAAYPVATPPDTHQVGYRVTQQHTQPGEAFHQTPDPNKSKSTPMSSSAQKPPNVDVVPLVPNRDNSERREQAKEILGFLNAKTGRNFRKVDANIGPIMARIKEGATVRELRAVVARKCRDWSGDEKMAQYLRPATLFNATKFAQYVGEVPPEKQEANGGVS